ncbi:MAG: tryptophan-rich sensory protein [Candidatus Marinimicrobia bacterium]|nr:tryptophan-rich sensory protein [Candidatus Neomarinimicrobiota bacterium]
MKVYLKFLVSVAIPFIIMIVGSIFTSKGLGEWYTTLNKPSFNPPSWAFPIAWTTIYTLMGIAFFLIWQNKTEILFKPALLIYAIQLILNLFWPFFFFILKNPMLAFIDIVLLWIAIIATIVIFNKISTITTYLLLPYLLWVSFASILNFSIMILNS